MKFKFLTKSMCAIISIMMSSYVYAIDPPAACPTLAMMKESFPSLSDAFKAFGNYEVVSDTPPIHFSNWDWNVSVLPVLADSTQEAISKAQQIIQTVYIAQKTPTPLKGVDQVYGCMYTAKESNVMAITYQNSLRN